MPALNIFPMSYPKPSATPCSLPTSKESYLCKKMPCIINVPSLIIVLVAVTKYRLRSIWERRGFAWVTVYMPSWKEAREGAGNRGRSGDHGGTLLSGLLTGSYSAACITQPRPRCVGMVPAHSGPGIPHQYQPRKCPTGMPSLLLSRCVRLNTRINHYGILMNEGFPVHFS